MRLLFLIIFCFSTIGHSQSLINMDSISIKNARDFKIDDYGNVYIYRNQNLSLTKYDSLGKNLAQQMMTRPYKIQAINNPLNLFLFSENTQELRLLDQNLNDIQSINFKNFGFLKAVYVEDLQTLWLLDDSTKNIVQYNYRTEKIINTFPFFVNTDNLVDFLVYNNKVYLLQENNFKVYDLKSNLLFSKPIKSALNLKRENDFINIFTGESYHQYLYPGDWKSKNLGESTQIVDKNQSSFLVLKQNKLYIYRP